MVAAAADVNIPTLIVAGTLGMLILAMGIIIFIVVYQKKVIRQQSAMQKREQEHQYEMLEASIETQEKERNRIAQDLHDDVGAMLSALKLSLNVVHRKAEPETEMAEYTLEAKKMIDETISSVRRLSKELLPATLKEFGLDTALEELASKLNRGTDISISFQSVGDNSRYDEKVELALFRVTQELLNNAMKHSGAENIDIVLDSQKDTIQLKVNDDGVGFDKQAVLQRGAERGLGLRNIESRLALVPFAEVDFNSAPGRGTQVSVNIRLT